MEIEIYGKERCQHLQKVNVVVLQTLLWLYYCTTIPVWCVQAYVYFTNINMSSSYMPFMAPLITWCISLVNMPS